jgi:hypothetical protein
MKNNYQNYTERLGFNTVGETPPTEAELIHYINIKLKAQGYPPFKKSLDSQFFKMADPFLRHHKERIRLLSDYFSPADQRIHQFLDQYFSDTPDFKGAKLPSLTFLLARHGVSRTLSLAPDSNSFESKYVKSYRVPQGVIHNPRNDRRTTKGVFHVVEGGLPIAHDKREVPKVTFARLFKAALQPPPLDMQLPFTSTQEEKAEVFLSLLLRPIVSPEVPSWQSEKSMEIRFFAPGGLVSNLDFVESIFGNAGDPYMPQNDAGLDPEHWTGHTGCVILAPHLNLLTKKELGLPNIAKATARQKRDSMCWTKPNEKYNDGEAFKITCRDNKGVIVTIIADNYFGYCKKEVKTQISYSSNLFGLCEEEHAGGAIAFPSFDLGQEFQHKLEDSHTKSTFDRISKKYKPLMDKQKDGYGIDKTHSQLIYVPENSYFSLLNSNISWGKEKKIPLKPNHIYMLPSGFRISLHKHGSDDQWRLVGTQAKGTLCHKPCTVSGGGKSEISKSLTDTMLTGSIYVDNIEEDFALIENIMKHDFSKRFRKEHKLPRKTRAILSKERSLGSVIKLLTPSQEFTDKYNHWVHNIPPHLKTIIFAVKRLYNAKWKKNWQKQFHVDRINGSMAHELKYNNRPLNSYFFRVGFEEDGSWRVFNTRYDFATSEKLQVEDDITSSIVIPVERLPYKNGDWPHSSVKLVKNCEFRLFQRPDDAIHPGQDKTTENDLATPNSFLSNFEPLKHKDLEKIADNLLEVEKYSKPMQTIIKEGVQDQNHNFFCISSHPRIVNSKPTKNPRYLQDRPDMVNNFKNYVANVSTRLYRNLPLETPIVYPVNAVLPGRRNNRPEPEIGVPALAVYNPIHYQELPELFMDFISSVTGKSPSTTGFGSEGALTKGPFNALQTAADLNNAFLSYIVTGYNGFSSAAGVIGPYVEVSHDISLLIPEIWSRMTPAEQDPQFLIDAGCLEKVSNFDHKGKQVPAHILGYRITLTFVNLFLGRIFNNPDIIFNDLMLHPEKQDLNLFAEGIENLMTTHKRVAQGYLEDGSIKELCPPLQALINIMATGNHKGKVLTDPAIRRLFNRDTVMKSDWYQSRLKEKQKIEIKRLKKQLQYMQNYLSNSHNQEVAQEINLKERQAYLEKELKHVQTQTYLKSLIGTLGAQKF